MLRTIIGEQVPTHLGPMKRALYSLLLLPFLSNAQNYLEQFPLREQTKYFDFRYKRNSEKITEVARFSDAFIKVLNRDFFKVEFDYPIRVLVLEDRTTFGAFLRRDLRINDPPGFGICVSDKLFVTYEDSGLGTFTHEIMHPLVETNLKNRPLWALEGIPTFFEKFYGYWKGDDLVLKWGYHNPWRIQRLGTNLMRLNLRDILSTRDSVGPYAESDLRMVSVFLWEQGKFKRFLELIQKGQKDGFNSYFEAAMEMPLERIEPLWRTYLNDVSVREREIMRLPSSTVLKDELTFQRFARVYGVSVGPSEKIRKPARTAQ